MMGNNRRRIGMVVGLVVIGASALAAGAAAAVAGYKARYTGGTIAAIPLKCSGYFNLEDEQAVRFICKGAVWEVPYRQVRALEYGGSKTRTLFISGRKHLLTIHFTDRDGKQQLGLFELSGDSAPAVLKTLELRTGKQVKYEAEEAEKKP